MRRTRFNDWRWYASVAAYGIFGCLIVYRLVVIQIVHHQAYLAKASSQQLRKFEIPAERGDLYLNEDGNLYPLALNETLKYVYADPKFVTDPKAEADKLAPVLGLDQAELAAQLTFNGKDRYIELKQKVTTSDADKIKALKLAGIVTHDRDYRYYPESSLFAHVLGYVNVDGNGQYGLEQYLDTQLKGKAGQLKAITDSLGVPIESQENIISPAQNGQSYVLTLDRKIQALAAEAIAKAVTENKASSGSIIVMDPKFGAIRALVNYPTYDPNDYAAVKPNNYNVFVNSAVSNLYEPGSGFKVITMSTGLEAGKVTPDTTYTDTGSLDISGYTIHNAENKTWGVQSMNDVIQKSLNTGVVFVLRMLGTDPNAITFDGKKLLNLAIKKFGFGSKTGIEQAGEANSKVKEPTVADIDYANMTFGQGISVTSIQMIRAVAAIANGGKLIQPHLVDKIIKPNGEMVDNNPGPSDDHVISQKTASAIAQMMTLVVEHGSGYLAKTPGYQIAGKTGTAQVPRADGKGYEDGKNIGSFVGFAPVSDPQFIILVRVDLPQVPGFAESTAVPAFATVARELFRYYQIPPNSLNGQ